LEVFDLVSEAQGFSAVERALGRARTTNQKVFKLAQVLNRLKLGDWDAVEKNIGAIIAEVRYEVTRSQVVTAYDHYLAWSGDAAGASTSEGPSARDQNRLRRIVEQLWLPEAESLPFRLSVDVDGVNERQVESRTFTWVQYGFQVKLSWVDEDTNLWLLEEFFPRLSPESPRRFGEEWRELQRRMCHYLNEAREYFWAFDIGMGHVTLADVENSTFKGGGRYGGQVHPRVHPYGDVRRAYMLLKEPAHLGFSVTQFRKRLIAYAGV